MDEKLEVMPPKPPMAEMSQANPNAWRKGLAMSNQAPRPLPSVNALPAPSAPINAIVRVPAESQLLNQPPQQLESPRANAQLAAVHAGAKSAEVGPMASQPSAERPKQFIREPQR